MEAEANTIPIALAEKRRLSCPLLALETGDVGELVLVENADGVDRSLFHDLLLLIKIFSAFPVPQIPEQMH
jgi:hypothetical protein